VRHHIDLSSVLRQTASCELYSNLVTRPTGAAVRHEIERLLDGVQERSLTVIDFTHVSMIDFSCADEVIAKLLLQYCAANPPHDAYFLFRGVTDDHWDAIEAVLERHGLALAMEQEDGVHVVGVLSDDERRAWDAVSHLGYMDAESVALSTGRDAAVAQRTLESLWRRRLVMKTEDGYVAVGGGGEHG
jgi:hypothetical protein